MLQQLICIVKVRRGPARHDNVDFQPIITKTSDIKPLSVAVTDKGYDSGREPRFGERTSKCIQHHSTKTPKCAHLENTRQVPKTDETGLSKDTIQPAQQR